MGQRETKKPARWMKSVCVCVHAKKNPFYHLILQQSHLPIYKVSLDYFLFHYPF